MIALITALPEELSPLAKKWKKDNSVFDKEGGYEIKVLNLNGVAIALLVTDIGFQHAQRATQYLINNYPIKCIIATGYAGGLSPLLSKGDLVLANEVKMLEVIKPAFPSPELIKTLDDIRVKDVTLHKGTIITSNKLIKKWEDKQTLSSSGVAVDMESAAIAQVASQYNIPWGALRAITDEWNEDLALDFLNHKGDNGHINYKKVVLSTLSKPLKIPRLFCLGVAAKIATKKLTLFWKSAIPKLAEFT